ncbi:hypothetical protein F5877DRAFT_66489 [Lentinula edodes]|nr:hypothetical protein F5877DRAFT_66489 [Lentinula edodes]
MHSHVSLLRPARRGPSAPPIQIRLTWGARFEVLDPIVLVGAGAPPALLKKEQLPAPASAHPYTSAGIPTPPLASIASLRSQSRLQAVEEEEEEEGSEIGSTVRYESQADKDSHGWLHSVTSSSLVIPLSSPGLPIPGLIKTGEPNRLRGGDNYTAGLSPSSADIAVDSEPPFSPYVLYTYHSHHNSSTRTSPYFLLNLPVRSLTKFTSLPSPSGPPNLPAITVTPIASPGESIDSYHNDGLLDPALLEVRQCRRIQRRGVIRKFS